MKSVLAILLMSLIAAQAVSVNHLAGELDNGSIAWHWQLAGGKFDSFQVDDKLNGTTLSFPGICFELVLGDGTVLNSSGFDLNGPPKIEKLKREPASPVAARHFSGEQFVASFSAPQKYLSAEWHVILRKGSSYLREELVLHAAGRDVPIREIVLLDERIPGARTVGTVDGSPVVAGDFFLGYEQPMAQNQAASNGFVRCRFLRNAILKDGETLTQSCVIGVAPPGQMRRGFLAYLERERAHPYRTFLHYNSWYDISWADRKFNQAESVNAIREVGMELVKKRGVRMDSFLFDDGWDDDRTLWNFNRGFPNGFTPLKDEAEKFHAEIGVWISPFGGYGGSKLRRIRYASQFGFETNASGFSLAGPKYYARFLDICTQMIREYGVNQFKFDGLAAGEKAGANGLTRDGDAMLGLIGDLRRIEPGIYINQTTGTWPSPFWLLSVDSTWRGGMDHWFMGKGSWCQQWMTYRDAQTYQHVVQCGPLYPLSSLMLHGIIYATNALHLSRMDDADFADQVRAFFGSGTQLQELYLTPALLDETNWDVLAEAAKWSRANADVLSDTHWVGGNPARGEVYGWASWSPHKAVLVLRNPDDQAADFAADAAKIFELPPDAMKTFRLQSPWPADRHLPEIRLLAGAPHVFHLQPFQVLVLDSQ